LPGQIPHELGTAYLPGLPACGGADGCFEQQPAQRVALEACMELRPPLWPIVTIGYLICRVVLVMLFTFS
ncbi:MAG: hypothetical protein FWG40_03830, partial [Peptococcaceae bacterium]|nr:hypothetical protein [Peptococcaceae bacterium]